MPEERPAVGASAATRPDPGSGLGRGPAGADRPAEGTSTRAPGWREVLLVAVAIVGVSLGAAAVTGLLPTAAQEVVFRTPLVIVVLLVGTVGLMVRLAMRRPSA